MTLKTERQDQVSIITLNRPEVLNAFDDEMGLALLDAVRESSADPGVRCIVIIGEGRAFSSGEDLGALADSYERGEAPPLGDTLVRRYNPLIEAVVAAPKPVVAVVNGVAAGAGASLALACDFRIVSAKAKFVLAFVKVGLVPDSGAVWFLTRALGHARAMELSLLGSPLDAATALEYGLATQVHSPEDLDTAWRSFATELSNGPTRAFALIKQLGATATTATLKQQLETEIQAQSEAGSTADHLEGVQAFLGKRAPNFRGS